MKSLLVALSFYCPLSCLAQLASNMVKVCDETCTVTAAPANAVYQFGTGTSFSAPMTQTLPLFASCADPCPWFGGDPDVGIGKTLYVQQQAQAFSVTWNNATGVTSAVIPALPVATPLTGTVTTPTPATVTTKAQPITTTAPVVPAQSVTITTPKNGGKVTFSIPAQTLAPLTATVPGQTAPVTSVPGKLLVTCPNMSALPNGQPDWTQPFTCTAVPQ